MDKICTKCKVTKPLGEFYNATHHKDGKTSQCKQCTDRKNKEWESRNKDKVREYRKQADFRRRDYRAGEHLFRTYGLTKSEYTNLLTKQQGLCAICKREESGVLRGSKRRMGVDHNHKTGRIRGLLCDDCNTGIARLQESPEILRIAARYVEVGND